MHAVELPAHRHRASFKLARHDTATAGRLTCRPRGTPPLVRAGTAYACKRLASSGRSNAVGPRLAGGSFGRGPQQTAESHHSPGCTARGESKGSSGGAAGAPLLCAPAKPVTGRCPGKRGGAARSARDGAPSRASMAAARLDETSKRAREITERTAAAATRPASCSTAAVEDAPVLPPSGQAPLARADRASRSLSSRLVTRLKRCCLACLISVCTAELSSVVSRRTWISCFVASRRRRPCAQGTGGLRVGSCPSRTRCGHVGRACVQWAPVGRSSLGLGGSVRNSHAAHPRVRADQRRRRHALVDIGLLPPKHLDETVVWWRGEKKNSPRVSARWAVENRP